MASTPARQLKNGPRLVDAPPVRAEKPARNPEEKVQKTGTMDRPLLLLIFLLVGLGLLCLFSASYATAYDSKDGNSTFYIFRQAIFAVGGSAAMLVLSRRNYHKLHYLAIPSLILAVAVMATIKVPGLKNMWVTINQATRWIKIPLAGTFQPSELAKIAVILCFSSLATIYGKKKMHTLRYGILPFMGIIAVFAVEMYWEKHLSGTALIAAIGMVIIFIGGANIFWFGLGGVSVGAAGIWYIKSHEYAMTRIRVWLDPFLDYRGKGWQGAQSQIAIGSGGLWGLGLGQSRQKHLYLPEPANDFIFSVWCEEMGFVGAVLLVLLFAALIWRGYYIALHCPDKFGTLLAAGITTQIAVQTILNLCVVTGLLPVTGASLPFFSYGGTALLIQLAEMGILLAISRELPVSKEG
ncbi:MAG: putative lipid II flippase FtsW [Clostridia bacterium]|nr:putative lipid II flippase FtsW [Clostridia bacterium]MDD7671661.1 putative peptidoglycan glycosyltransferase FtsW [Clostridia bacterium]